MRSRRWGHGNIVGRVVVGVLLAAAAGGWPTSAGAASAHVSCSEYASPSGSDATGDGSPSSPFRTAQQLVNSLRPGHTGCLNAGTYSAGTYGVNGLAFHHGGASAAPITLSSTPGQTATIRGGDYFIYTPQGSDYITIENLHINMASPNQQPTQVNLQIDSFHDQLINDDITNGSSAATCIILGSNGGYGQAVGTVIKNSTIHDCGNYTIHGNQDHAIYFENSVSGVVTNNVIYDTAGFAIHLYPNAQRNQITHNVIDSSHYGGVIFAGDSSFASSNNIVDYNVVTNDTFMSSQAAISSYWGGRVGFGNHADHNCLYDNVPGDIGNPTTGFSATRNLIVNPGFTNPAKHEYRLKQDGPCLRVVGYDTAAQLRAAARRASVRHRRGRREGSAATRRRHR
jgi:parallel beta-helix repeat protein